VSEIDYANGYHSVVVQPNLSALLSLGHKSNMLEFEIVWNMERLRN